MSDQWYYAIGKESRGPLSLEALIGALVQFPAPATVPVWCAGMSGWQNAGTVREVASELSRRASVPPLAPPDGARTAGEHDADDRPLEPEPRPAEPEAATKLSPARTSKGFVAKHWRGEYPLWLSYWIIGFLANLVIALIAVLLAGIFTSADYQPLNLFLTVSSIWLTVAIFASWQSVGIWRAASRYALERRQTGKGALWSGLAKLAVILGCLGFLVEFASGGGPQLAELSRMAFLADPGIPDYSIRVMREGTEAEIAGGIKYGLMDDLRKTADAHPRLKTVHLHSRGGRIGEAERLSRFIREKGLTTYTSAECLSACTVAFAGGRERWLLNRAKLGFHRGAFPGTKDEDLGAIHAQMKATFLAAGFDPAFVERALSTPHNALLTPPVAELLKANVITAVSQGSDFAASGYGVGSSKPRIEALLASAIPILPALKKRLDHEYGAIIDAYYNGYTRGETEAALLAQMRGSYLKIIATYRPLANDDVLRDFGRLAADQYEALGKVDATVCYGYSSDGRGSERALALLPPHLVQRESELSVRIINTFAPRAPVTDEQADPIWHQVFERLKARGLGDGLAILSETQLAPSKHAEYCQASVELMREISNLEEPRQRCSCANCGSSDVAHAARRSRQARLARPQVGHRHQRRLSDRIRPEFAVPESMRPVRERPRT
jgi:hypothetical protein